MGQTALTNGLTAIGLGAYLVAMVVFASVVRLIESRPARADDGPLAGGRSAPIGAGNTVLAVEEPFALAVDARTAPTVDRRYIQPIVLCAISLLALIFATLRVDVPGGLSAIDDRLTVLAWLVSIGAFSAAVLRSAAWQFPPWRVVAASLNLHRRELGVIGLLAGVALVIRLYQFDSLPYPFLKDEAFVGVESVAILRGQITNLFQPGWSLQPVWASLPTALSVAVFGNTIFALRLVSAVLGTLNIVMLYLLARLWFDRLTAFLAAGFLLAVPLHLQFSRLGVTNLIVPFFATLIFWLIYRAIRSGRTSDYLWAGLVVGASFYSYLGSRLVVALAFFSLAYYCLYQRNYLRQNIRQLLVFGLAAAIVALPILYFFSRHMDMAMSAYNGSGIIPTGWLEHEVTVNGRSVFAVLFDQVARSTLVFTNEPATAGFFNSPKPYLTPVSAVLFVLGLVLTIWRWREPRSITLLSWFWSVVIVGSALTLTPPTSERLVGSLPAVALFAALGLVEIAKLLKRLKFVAPAAVTVLCVGVVGVSSALDVGYYFGEYRDQRYFAHYSEELELNLSQVLRPVATTERLYLLTGPATRVGFFPTHDYLLPALEVHDLLEFSPEAVAALPRDKGLFFVAIPEHEGELKQIALELPGGQWSTTPRLAIPGSPPEVLYYAYQLPAGS